MILIADSGSTKTSWAVVEIGSKVVTEGLNPHFTSEEQFMKCCATVRSQIQNTDADCRIFFYGAGCGLAEQRKKTTDWLSKAFGTSDVHVGTDMLGACRATAADRPAIVGILGTGSNACCYDGQQIACQPTSTGYILGDKGSANHVGRVLLNDYLTHRMPEGTRGLFQDSYPMNDAQMLDAVYHQPYPNRFLASLAPFAVRHLDVDYCRRTVTQTLEDWWLDILRPLCLQNDSLPFCIVGGYAKAIEPLLRTVLTSKGLNVNTVLADPIDGLLDFHRDSKKS